VGPQLDAELPMGPASEAHVVEVTVSQDHGLDVAKVAPESAQSAEQRSPGSR
jgi:hypothetical protein